MERNFDSSAARYWFPKPYADVVARLRVPGGFLLLIVFAWRAAPTHSSLAIGFPICAVGLLMRAWAAGHLSKNEQLATTGPYAYVRNPLYIGTLLVAAGIVIASRDLLLTVIFAAVFLLVYLPAVELEEQHLRNLFPSYTAYASRVNRFLPWANTPGAAGSFTWTRYMRNQEYNALIGFAIAASWLLWRCRSQR